MPAVDTVLLPLCVGLTLLGVIVTGVAWRRGNRGRVVQGVGLALAPIALYFSGLLRLLWDAVGRARQLGVQDHLLAGGLVRALRCSDCAIVLWVVGGIVAKRFAGAKAATPAAKGSGATPAVQPARQEGRGAYAGAG